MFSWMLSYLYLEVCIVQKLVIQPRSSVREGPGENPSAADSDTVKKVTHKYHRGK